MTIAIFPPHDAASPAAASPAEAARLRECPMCGLFQSMPDLPHGTMARCVRCGAPLRQQRTEPTQRALALATTALLLFVLATMLPFMDFDLHGQDRETTLLSGPRALETAGMWELSLVVLITTTLAPLAKLGSILWVLVGLRLPNPPRNLAMVFRWVELLSPWSMVEVFMLGVFVAYTKLTGLAFVQIGGAVYALGAIMLAMAAADAVLDHETVWREIEQCGRKASAVAGRPERESGPLIGCDACGYVSHNRHTCPRCGGRLHHRKPDSRIRCWALLIAAAALYVPANTLPVMTVIQFGSGSPNTILSGVEELIGAGEWPLAMLVFVASITVPVLKLLGLATLLITTRLRITGWRRERTALYRVVEAVGRWSMIDVFMVSILTALVRMGQLASVTPGPGVICFCAVVILTMLASHSFDPRLMWDAAEPSPPRIPE